MELNNIDHNKITKANDDLTIPNHVTLDLYLSAVDEGSINFPEKTLPELLSTRANERPDFTAFKSKSNGEGVFDLVVSQSEYLDLTKIAARSFIKLGLEEKSAVGIIGFNHIAWAISQMGCIFAGGLSCGIYTTNTADMCKFIMKDCNCQVMVVENSAQLMKILSFLDQCSQIKALVQYTGIISDDLKKTVPVPILTWQEFLAVGSEDENAELEKRRRNIRPRDAAILIYTSGTTGMPKGVMLSHDNVIWVSHMLLQTLGLKMFDNCVVSYLPFSHIAANLFDLIGPICIGTTVYFAQPDALKGSLNKTMLEVRPTLFLGVPRVFEKIQEKLEETAMQFRGCKKILWKWAREVGTKNSRAKQAGISQDIAFTLFNYLIFSNIKKRLGLDRCSYIASGAAPTALNTLHFFESLDITIHQVYGMSECSGPHTIGRHCKPKIGTVGNLIKGVEMKIANPDEDGAGEIYIKGRHVFLGYFNANKKTDEVLDQDGWLHSGDLGKIVDNEFLAITGRIKELIITAGGENIAPVPIEEKIKEKVPFISNAMLIGDKRKFISCLLTVKTIMDFETQQPTNKLTPGAVNNLKEVGIDANDIETLLGYQYSALKTVIDDAIKDVNKCSASQAAHVQKWCLLPRDFSIYGGELGPTLKLKRPVITEIHADVIDRMYS